MTSPANEYEPNYATVPGETIREAMAERRLTAVALADRLGVSSRNLASVLDGEAPITEDLAQGLESALGIPGAFWLALERNYRESLSRISHLPAGVP